MNIVEELKTSQPVMIKQGNSHGITDSSAQACARNICGFILGCTGCDNSTYRDQYAPAYLIYG